MNENTRLPHESEKRPEELPQDTVKYDKSITRVPKSTLRQETQEYHEIQQEYHTNSRTLVFSKWIGYETEFNHAASLSEARLDFQIGENLFCAFFTVPWSFLCVCLWISNLAP